MADRSFDPNALFETFRSSLAPVMRAQQESLKALDRLAHYQYALAGDYLEWSLSQAKAVLAAKNPAELVAKQTELGTKLSDQLRGRVQEFSSLASEAQSSMTALFDEATAKFAEVTKKAA
jgi:phasin family protein